MSEGRASGLSAALATECRPVAKHCAFCYAVTSLSGDFMRCGKCKRRRYCSRSCQTADWKGGAHKMWCGSSGEKDSDWEIRESGNKGFGVFLLRDFAKNEKILIERAVLVLPNQSLTSHAEMIAQSFSAGQMIPGEVEAFDALSPANGSRLEKFEANSASLDDSGTFSGIFLDFARINHDCVGNSHYKYLEDQKVMILVAKGDLSSGSEVTFSYRGSLMHEERVVVLRQTYQFTCDSQCQACSNCAISAKLDRANVLDKQIIQLGASGQRERALGAGQALLALYDELGGSARLYSRTYFILYQIAIAKRETFPQGVVFIQKAAEMNRLYFGCDCEATRRIEEFAANPKSHACYLKAG